MSFLWPEALWLGVLLPLLVALYVWLMRRRKKAALRYASLSLVKDALGTTSAWRRHLPPALLLTALAVLVIATARPAAVITLPTQQQTIILAMDVSGSMRAADVQPNRLVASQNAAKQFIADLPRDVRVGIVAFAGTAQLVQPPTHNREDLVQAIDRFQLQRATAIGSAIVISLATIFPEANIDLSQVTGQRNMPRALQLDGKDNKTEEEFKPVPPGSYTSAAVILLTDGQRTTGPDPIDAAKMAADRGVKVFTVGFGTKEGEIIGFEGWSMRVRLDEDTLKSIASITHAEYFYAGSANDLRKAYEALTTRLVMEKRETEITALFAAGAALLALAAGALSVWWFGRVV
jgi:Ca-activated chloride channel family protein